MYASNGTGKRWIGVGEIQRQRQVGQCAAGIGHGAADTIDVVERVEPTVAVEATAMLLMFSVAAAGDEEWPAGSAQSEAGSQRLPVPPLITVPVLDGAPHWW